MTAVIEKSIGAALIALTLIGSGYPMTAKAMGPAPQSVDINAGITIRFADLDLSKPEGIAPARLSLTIQGLSQRR
jgi:hypothetical protein